MGKLGYVSDWHGVHKVVKPEELEGATRHGWVLVEIIETEEVRQLLRPMDLSKEEARRYRPPVFYVDQAGRTQQVSEGCELYEDLARTVLFVVKKNESTALEELGEKVRALEAQHVEAECQLRQREDALAEQEKELVRVKGQLRTEEQQVEALRGAAVRAQEQRQAFERDIGKIRAALGDLRMKEILGR